MTQILCNNYTFDMHVQSYQVGFEVSSFTILIISVPEQERYRSASLSEPWLFADAISTKISGTVSYKVGKH